MIDLLYSDMHLMEDRLHIYEHIHDRIFQIAHDEGVIDSGGYLINGGDTFHVRGVIRTSCFDLLYRKRFEWRENGVKKHIDIIGNHDQEDKDGVIHPMSVFREFGKDWHVVDKPQVIDMGLIKAYAFPYMSKLKEHIDAISTSKRKNAIALVHTGVHGAFKNDGELDDFSIYPDVFNGFRAVFSGHYHNRKMYGGIVQYIGSPTQHSFSEMDQEKGVLIYNRKTNKFKFVAIDGPKHFEVKVKWDEDGKRITEGLDQDIADKDIVRIRVHGSSNQVLSVKREDFGLKCNFKIERKTKDSVSSRINTEGASNDDLIKKYVDYVDPDIDHEKLLMIGKKLIGDLDATT